MLRFIALDDDGFAAEYEYASVDSLEDDWRDEGNCGTPSNDSVVVWMTRDGEEREFVPGISFLSLLRLLGIKTNGGIEHEA